MKQEMHRTGTATRVSSAARYAFAHGGKDGHRSRWDRAADDQTIAALEASVRRARIGAAERLVALRRFHRCLAPPPVPDPARPRQHEEAAL
jgi:hypothetical protein